MTRHPRFRPSSPGRAVGRIASQLLVSLRTTYGDAQEFTVQLDVTSRALGVTPDQLRSALGQLVAAGYLSPVARFRYTLGRGR